MSHIEHSKSIPKIAIIGRPNVGKSSLFNRMLKQRKAIVQAVPGVTRDRLCALVKFSGYHALVIDTGGMSGSRADSDMESLVYKQSMLAIDEAEAVLFVCDIRTGITSTDSHIADVLRKRKKKVFLVANKADDKMLENDAYVFYGLGLGEPHVVSVVNNIGFDRLNKDISAFVSKFYKAKQAGAAGVKDILSERIRIAIAGRPNVGKSSFINTILEEERLLVDNTPGTTRDSIDITIKRGNRLITIIDTAGMRHKKKFKDVVEVFSLARTRQALRHSDIVIVMIEAQAGLTRDDIAVLEHVIKDGKGCILLVNKIDLLDGIDFNEYRKDLVNKYRPAEWMQIIFTSCKRQKNIIKALDSACALYKKSKLMIPTPALNKFFQNIQKHIQHTSRKGARGKVLYAVQKSAGPHVFMLFCSNMSLMRREFIKQAERQLRKEFGLEGIPISFQIKPKNAKGKNND